MRTLRLRKSQWGGTILGLILGILIGLAIAAAVTIYTNKIPIPIKNESQTRTPAQDAAEAQRNNGWNPNTQLDVSGPVLPPPASAAVDPAASEPTRSTTSQPAPALVPEAQAPASKPSTVKPASEDPLGDLLRERAGRDSNARADDPFTYFVQAGAFRSQSDAEAQRARLNLLGIQARVSEREQAGRVVYRVRVGPFDNKDAADKAKAQLDSNSVDSALVRVQR